MDRGEEQFFVDSKPIGGGGWHEGHAARWDGLGTLHKLQTSVTALHKRHIISDINCMLSVD